MPASNDYGSLFLSLIRYFRSISSAWTNVACTEVTLVLVKENFCAKSNLRYVRFDIVKLQSQVQTSVLVLPLSQQQEQEQEPPPKVQLELDTKDQVLFFTAAARKA